MTARYAPLDDRFVLTLAGPDTLTYLQGIVTSDVEPAGRGRAVFAALLSPQGRYLHDFILVPRDGRFLLDCERARVDDLKRRLALYRLRAKVSIEDPPDDIAVFALFGDGAATAVGLADGPGDVIPFAGGLAYVDPRLARLGARALLPRKSGAATLQQAGLAAAVQADYERHRLMLGVAEGEEIGVDKTLALEAGLDALNGISFAKGCYIGQEVTSRMHNRKLVRKRIVPVVVEGPPPDAGTAVRLGDTEAGTVCAAGDGIGLALLRLESLAEAAKNGATLRAGDATLKPQKAEWLGIPADGG